MAPPVLDFWFEFASTYSYPAMMRITSLARDAGIAVKFRPFLLGPVFKAQGWETSPFNLYATKGRNMWRDLERLCEELNLPFRRPEPFPQNSLQASRLALVGLDAQWGEDFCRSVFRTEFAEGCRIDETACDRRPKKLSNWEFSERRALSLRMESCSGVTTVLNARSPG